MLVIRMQRTGRSGHAQFRVVVQDSRRTPTSGKIVAQVGSYNPHSKQTTLDKEKAQFYLDHGAQPSPRVARLLKAEGVKLPAWVKIEEGKKRGVRNADKRRSTRPASAEASEDRPPEPVEAEPVASEETAAEVPTETPAEEPAAENETAEEAPADEVAEEVEAPAEESSEAPAEPDAGTEPETNSEEEAAETPVAEEATDSEETTA